MEKIGRRQQKGVLLPPVTLRHQNTTESCESNPSQDSQSLLQYLRHVRRKQLCIQHHMSAQQMAGLRKMQLSERVYQQAVRKQVKKLNCGERTVGAQLEERQEVQPGVVVRKIETKWKPPHRYKTAIALFDDQLLVYAGLGCEKHRSWAKLSLKNHQWTTPRPEESTQAALYGHSLGVHRGIAYVYGGSCLESTTHELLAINLKTMSSCSLPPAPYRRKQHAMTFLSRFMLIHGGIETATQSRSTLFYYDTETARWNTPMQHQLPHLSHHAMAAVPTKTRRKPSFLDCLHQAVYIFGGKDENGAISARLVRLKTREGGEVVSEEVLAAGGPEPRHSLSMQFVQPNFLCVYGGRAEEKEGQLATQGIFGDILLFNLDIKEWLVPTLNIALGNRFGASSCSHKNKMFIFGGSLAHEYADATILEIIVRGDGSDSEEEDFCWRRTRLRC